MNRGAAFVADAVTVAAASENHVSGVENVGGVVVGNNGLAFQNVIQFCILSVSMVANAATRGQYNTCNHTPLTEHL